MCNTHVKKKILYSTLYQYVTSVKQNLAYSLTTRCLPSTFAIKWKFTILSFKLSMHKEVHSKYILSTVVKIFQNSILPSFYFVSIAKFLTSAKIKNAKFSDNSTNLSINSLKEIIAKYLQNNADQPEKFTKYLSDY